MTGFFMLSGYSLFVNYAGTTLIPLGQLKTFYIKRIISIVPIYYIAAILYILINRQESILETIILIPTEALGLQTVFSTLFPVTHNGGTWFVSCILFCYLIYPFAQELTKQFSVKIKIIVVLMLIFILLYSPFIAYIFKTDSIYSNPFFRILEFSIGVILASLKQEIDNRKVSLLLYRWSFFLGILTLMVVGVTVAVKLGIYVDNYMMYSWICLPCFSLMMLSAGGLESTILSKSEFLKYFTKLSYCFFLAQLYSNLICIKITARYSVKSNIEIILLGWITCIVIAVILHEGFEKPVTQIIRKHIITKK